MDEQRKKEIIAKAKDWMKSGLIASHKKNTLKLTDLSSFNVNPFLLPYLGYYFEGNIEPITLAKVLVYPRVLGTSIATSFGTQMQRFISVVLGGYGSVVPGMDIEFEDKVDGRKKYAQVKSGPNSINRDDVTTVRNHFRAAINRARTNNIPIQLDDMVFCLLYGEPHEKNSFVKELEQDYTVIMGREFWHRFTGDERFYEHLIIAMGEAAIEVNMKDVVDEVVNKLALQIEKEYTDLYSASKSRKKEGGL